LRYNKIEHDAKISISRFFPVPGDRVFSSMLIIHLYILKKTCFGFIRCFKKQIMDEWCFMSDAGYNLPEALIRKLKESMANLLGNRLFKPA